MENISLAPFTTFGVGGPARYFCEPETKKDIEKAYAFARERAIPVFVLGRGSNILVSDAGYGGLVVRPKFSGMTIESDDSRRVFISVGAGEKWDNFVEWVIENGYSGIECLSGIPGTVGGIIFENAGAYGQNCGDSVAGIEAFDMGSGTWRVFLRNEADFSYHMSFFKKHSGRYCIVSAKFSFEKSRTVLVRCLYKDNKFDFSEMFPEDAPPPSLREMREAILAVRREKGMLEESFRSAGSFFGIPPVSRETFERIEQIARGIDKKKVENLSPWHWEQRDGTVKIAPAFLLEFTEFRRGYRRGNTGISPKHSLAIVNYGSSASEIRALAEDMKRAVENVFGVSLIPEVTYLGFF